MLSGGVKNVLIGLAFSGEAAPLLAAHVDNVLARFLKRGKAARSMPVYFTRPFVFIKIERCGFQRAIGGRAHGPGAGFGRGLTGVVIVADLLEPLIERVFHQRVEPDQSALAHILKDRIQMIMKQRQPVLGPVRACACADRIINRIARADRAEILQKA